jgi:hypothetical protein
MSAVRYLGVASTLALASGCIGTVDSLHYVSGEAPSAANCEVSISEAGGARQLKSEKVRGAFRVSYIASGPFPPRVDVAAYCDGTKVKEAKGVSPRNVGDTDFGKLAP